MTQSYPQAVTDYLNSFGGALIDIHMQNLVEAKKEFTTIVRAPEFADLLLLALDTVVSNGTAEMGSNFFTTRNLTHFISVFSGYKKGMRPGVDTLATILGHWIGEELNRRAEAAIEEGYTEQTDDGTVIFTDTKEPTSVYTNTGRPTDMLVTDLNDLEAWIDEHPEDDYSDRGVDIEWAKDGKALHVYGSRSTRTLATPFTLNDYRHACDEFTR